ncbi:MAG: hypothetical protein VW714_08325 [Rhodospirillales bacterium]
MLTIKSNAKEYQGFVNQLVNSQIPFAVSKAINITAVEARNGELHKEYQSTFEERNKAFFRQVHTIRPSSARDGKRLGRMVVAVQQSSETPPPGTVNKLTARQAPGVTVKYTNTHQPGKKRSVADTSFMKLHVKGGIKKPKGHPKLTIPTTEGPTAANIPRLKTTGAMPERAKPKTLINKGREKAWFNPPSGEVQKGKAVRLQERIGKKKILTHYHLKDSARIKARYKPVKSFESGVNNRIRRNFADALQYSLKTAKFRGLRFTDDG